MKGFNEISRMNLADLDRPEGLDYDEEEVKETKEAEESEVVESEEPVETEAEATTAKSAAEEMPRFPIGNYYGVNTTLQSKHFREFLFSHSYRQPIMIALTLLGVVALVSGLVIKTDKNVIMLMIALFVLVGYPLSYVSKARQTVRRNPIFQSEFHYTFDEWGAHLRCDVAQDIDVQWRQVVKIACYRSIAVVYTGKNNGYIVPYEDMGVRKDEILAFMKAQQQAARG